MGPALHDDRVDDVGRHLLDFSITSSEIWHRPPGLAVFRHRR